MRAHIIESGVVTNTIEVESLDFLPGLVDASRGGSIGWLYDGENFTPPATPLAAVPASVSPRQIRQSLNRIAYGDGTLRQAVEAAVAAGDQDLRDWWEFATEFERQNPHVAEMGIALGQSDEQLDDLWRLAVTL